MTKRLGSHVAAICVLGGAAWAQSGKLSPDLDRGAGGNMNVIVQFKQQPSTSQHVRVLRNGGSLRRELNFIQGAAYSVPAAALADLANDPEVAYISPDRAVAGTLDLTAAAVNAAAAWQAGYIGTGIGVAVIDSGVSNHDDLMHASHRIVYNQDFVGGGTDDHFGHGEHVAGVIAGDGFDSTCGIGYPSHNCTRAFKGIAPGANIVNLRVLDQNGQGSDSGVIAAIQKAIQLKSTYNIRVINLSLGRPVYESYAVDPLCQAVEAAWRAGIVVVVAAGNNGRNGYGTINAPGNDPYVITVGAMKTMGTPQRADDLVASYSSKGPTAVDHIVKPDIMAPGNLVASLLSSNGQLGKQYPQNQIGLSYYESTAQTNSSNQYFVLSGTSMATPVVSAAAAVLLNAHPSFTPDQVKARLMHSAYKVFPASSIATDTLTGQKYTSYYDIFTVGAGYLDIAAALADSTVFTGSAASPVASYNNQSHATSVVCPPASICGSQSLWNSQSLWGSQSLWDNQTLWDNTFFLKGTQSLWDSQSLWDNQTLWGSQSLWGATTVNAAEATLIAIYGEH